MAVTATVTDHWEDGKRVHAVLSLAFSGTYTVGGDTITVTNLSLIKSASAPVIAIAAGQASYAYLFTTVGKLKVISLATGLELTAAAYPAAVLADTVSCHSIFPKHI